MKKNMQKKVAVFASNTGKLIKKTVALVAMLALTAGVSFAQEDPSIWDVPAGVSTAFTNVGTLGTSLALLGIGATVVVGGAVLAWKLIKKFFHF